MKPQEYLPESIQLDELNWQDVKKGVGTAALATALMTPGNLDKEFGFSAPPVDKTQAVFQQLIDYVPLTNRKNEKVLANVAKKNNIGGVELAAFMAQMAHESQSFVNMVEDNANLERYGKGRVAKMLGNRNKHDAERFVGRGFIQLTGRWNYEWMQKELGMDLTSTWSNAHRASEPEIAAAIAVIYWKRRVQPKVDDFTDVKSVTKQINPALNGLNDRENKFNTIARNMNIPVSDYR